MSPPVLTPLTQAHFRRTPWKNGGGVTLDIADSHGPGAAPGGWAGMIWRLGRTTIATRGPFSDLTGYDRLQMVVAGRGLALETPDGEIDLREPFRAVRYDGATPIMSRLEDGPVEVVNLIADRARCAIGLAAIGAGSTVGLGSGVHVLYAPDEAASLRCEATKAGIACGDALRIDSPTGFTLSVAQGVVVLASVTAI